MNYKFAHNNISVLDLEKSLKFYSDALNLTEINRFSPADKSFTIVYLSDGVSAHKLELTHYSARKEKFNLGDNEIHLAMTTDNYEDSFLKHQNMNCVCYVNDEMGIYFIADPDGYWIEIIREA